MDRHFLDRHFLDHGSVAIAFEGLVDSSNEVLGLAMVGLAFAVVDLASVAVDLASVDCEVEIFVGSALVLALGVQAFVLLGSWRGAFALVFYCHVLGLL